VINGVPYDVAFSLDTVDLMAHTIVIGERHSNEWDFGAWRWKDRK
jgi:hypothetical protein